MPKTDAPRTIFRQVVDTLGTAVLRGDYGEGPLPVEAELAASLGVGRNLLREAIKVLASKNLVVVGPKIGTRALPRSQWNLLDPDVLLWLSETEASMTYSFDLVEFRLIVEPRAAHLAALRATAAERAEITAAYDAYEECLTRPELIVDRDLVFHQAIHTASHNTLLASIGWRLGTMMRRQVLTTTDYPGAFERGLPLHKELAEAIGAGDAAWAEEVAVRLVVMPYADLAGRLDIPPDQRLDNDVNLKEPKMTSISKTAGRTPGRRLRGMLLGAAIGAAALLGVTGKAAIAQGDAYSGTITYWFWGESDIPGIDNWMTGRIAAYERLHPGVKINFVPQSTDTLIGAFRLASQSKSEPDMNTQWATLPTLTPYWDGASVPISDYVPASETANWVDTSENTVGDKIIAMPIYLIGVPLVWNKAMFKEAGLDPDKAPATWSDFLADCAALKAHGITPLGMGNSDGYFGAWMFAIYAKQELNSLGDLKSAIGNTGGYSMADLDILLGKMYGMMQDLMTKGYVNSDVASLNLNQGWELFPQKKAAMSFTTDGNVLTWEKAVGAENIGVAMPPIWGSGKLAPTYDVTQSSDEFITSWSKNKAADAAFLVWLHKPENLASLYAATGAFPADKRFDTSAIKDPLAKQMFDMDTKNASIWLENYLPPEVDNNADIPAGQVITSKSGGPDQAVAIWNRVIKQWRVQQIPEYLQFKKWASNG